MPSSKPPGQSSFRTFPCRFFLLACLSYPCRNFRLLKSFSLFDLFSRIQFLLVDVFLQEVYFFLGQMLVWKRVCTNELVSHYASLFMPFVCTSCLLQISSVLSAGFYHHVKLTSQPSLSLFDALILRFSFLICIA